jgi:hypothetical protein
LAFGVYFFGTAVSESFIFPQEQLHLSFLLVLIKISLSPAALTHSTIALFFAFEEKKSIKF